MAKKKAKWLEESTVPQLLGIVKEELGKGEEADLGKVKKAVDELIERQPAEGDGQVTVTEAIAALESTVTKAIEEIKGAYQSELDSMDEVAGDTKEDDNEEDNEDDEEEGYDSMSSKALKKLCKEKGIKVTKSMKKEDFIAALTAAEK